MPYVPVPKDLTKIKTKVIGNLTKRQLVCFGLAGGVGIPVYLLFRKIVGGDIAAFMMVFAALPFFVFSMYEKNGQPAEKVLKNVLRVKFIYPAIRPYKTQNLFNNIDKYLKEVNDVGTKSGKKTYESERKKPGTAASFSTKKPKKGKGGASGASGSKKAKIKKAGSRKNV